jgi:hypothetical protein
MYIRRTLKVERLNGNISYANKNGNISYANQLRVQTMQTPVTIVGSPSDDQIERWNILSLKPSHQCIY